MLFAQQVALVLKAPVSLSTLATVAVYQAEPEGQKGAGSCQSGSSTTVPAGYQPVPAEIDRAHHFTRTLASLKLCDCACVVLSAGTQASPSVSVALLAERFYCAQCFVKAGASI